MPDTYINREAVRLKDLQRKIDRPMKGYYKGQPRGVFELEQRFRAELEREAADNA